VIAMPFFFGEYLVLLAVLVGVYTLSSFGMTVLTGHTGSGHRPAGQLPARAGQRLAG
jgi:hypothetical protein